MANLPSQRKRNRTNEIARLRNNDIKSALKTYVKRVRSAEQDGDLLAAEAALKVASRALDKAVTKGVIHQNQAANRKSALAKQINRMRLASGADQAE